MSGRGWRLMGLERKIWSDRWFYAALKEWDISFHKLFLGSIIFLRKMAGEAVETVWEFNEKPRIWVPLLRTS